MGRPICIFFFQIPSTYPPRTNPGQTASSLSLPRSASLQRTKQKAQKFPIARATPPASSRPRCLARLRPPPAARRAPPHPRVATPPPPPLVRLPGGTTARARPRLRRGTADRRRWPLPARVTSRRERPPATRPRQPRLHPSPSSATGTFSSLAAHCALRGGSPCRLAVGSSSPSAVAAQLHGRIWQQLTTRPFAGDEHPPGSPYLLNIDCLVGGQLWC